MPVNTKKKTGIAFGGGGTRGIAHIGAIRVFQENGIDFDYVAGNSAGALAGAVYAAGIPWSTLYDFVYDIKRKLPNFSLFSYISPSVVENLADSFLKGMSFEDLKKPFRVIAVDLEQGTLDTLSSGSVSKALSASCAVPGIFRPVKIDGRTYIDGGTLRNIPTQTVREMGAQAVVGIDLNADRNRGTRSTRRIDVMITALNLSVNANSYLCELYSDIMLRPTLDDYPRHTFKDIEAMLRIGEETALDSMPKIKEILS